MEASSSSNNNHSSSRRRPPRRRPFGLGALTVLSLHLLLVLVFHAVPTLAQEATPEAAAAPAAPNEPPAAALEEEAAATIIQPPEAPVAPAPHRDESWRPPGSLVFHNGGPLSPPALELASADGRLEVTLAVDAFRQVMDNMD